MKRTIFCKITVDDETAFNQIDDGPISFLEKKIGELKEDNIVLEDAFLSDEDNENLWGRYIHYLAEWVNSHSSEADGSSPSSWDLYQELHSTVIQRAKSLPMHWNWILHNDQSGHLESPEQKEYFLYDWSTGEYKITPDTPWRPYLIESPASNIGYSIGGFKDFQKEAESWIRDNLL